MASTPSNMSPVSKNASILEESLALNELITRTKRHLVWGVLNAVLVSVILFNLLQFSLEKSMKSFIIYYAQCMLTMVLGINSLFHLMKYTFNAFSLNTVCVSPNQKKLLGLNLSDKYFKSTGNTPVGSPSTTPLSVKPEFTSTSPMNLSASTWLASLSPTSENMPSSPNGSIGSNSWQQGSPPHQTMALPTYPGEDLIRDELSLSRYLEAFETFEKKSIVSETVEQPASVISSFWNSPGLSSTAEVSPLLRRCVYQMATASTAQVNSSPNATSDDSHSPSSVTNNIELWRRLKVDPNRLTQWHANLRMWVSLTILQRVLKELDFIDEAFLRCSLSDLRLGSVGLDRLKKTATIPQVVASVPSLPRLVPFLELSPHQEYLVTRIRALAKGGSLSEFRWSSGGSLNGKSWEEHLPTDAALIMHLIATYLDLQLLPLPHRPDSRPFSSQHFVRTPEKPPKGSASPVIYQSQLNPPHFMIIDKEEVLEVPKGRNNVFHTFLLFLHILKTREHGMLGPVNLGLSGVNVLWVIDS